MLSTKGTGLIWMIALILFGASTVLGQSTTATLSGSVTDERDAAIAGATVKITNTDAGFERTVLTNENGTFTIPLLPPATYRVIVERSGFAPFEVSQVILNANDQKSLNLRLKVGQVGASVQVTADAPLIDESPAVGTTVNRQFVENLPLNGRSLQTLIGLSPGVVAVPVAANGGSQGQFSVNGQRANANYFTVDGMSGNFSVTNFEGLGQNASGSIPTTSITGNFASLASVESLQEFTIQTSTFAPEFGRSPGGQISLVTRSGENQYHGSLFEYVRNDKMDARDFFDTVRPKLRFNNFGGSFGGPVVLPWLGEGTPYLWKGKDRTFFFFAYEGQRFVLPQPAINITVPSIAARTTGAGIPIVAGLGAPNDLARSILNGFPLPNGPDIRDTAGNLTGGAVFTASYSNPSSSDGWNVRLDHNLTKNITLFGRYNFAPSNSDNRVSTNPTHFQTLQQNATTFTLGSSQVFGSKMVNEIRANYSHNEGFAYYTYDGYGGGIQPPPSILLPPSTAGKLVRATLNPITNITGGGVQFGDVAKNENRQFQLIDNFTFALGNHQVKFGGDYRLLLPITAPVDVIVATAGMTLASVYNNVSPTLIAFRSVRYVSEFKTFSFYGQDTWKINRKMSLTYGLRWEINPAPTGRSGKFPLTFSSVPDLSKLDQSSLTLAPIGTPYFTTDYTNFAPRVGLSYLISDKPGRELMLRGGVGMYYDLGQTGFGNVGGFPYSFNQFLSNIPLPAPESAVVFPPVNFTPGPTNRGSITVADPNYTLPRTYQWNLTAEQSLGKNQTLSVAYVGALGRKLVRVRTIQFLAGPTVPNIYYSSNFSGTTIIDNADESSYHSMQAQFTRRLSKGLQALASYTWSHSIDNGSTDGALTSPGYVFAQSVYRGNSDFDVRQVFSGAVTYQLPMPQINKFSDAILRGWSLNSVFSARTGLPFTPTISETTSVNTVVSFRRPNLVAGVPLYIPNTTGIRAGGDRLNPAAFDFNVVPGQMGSLGRNALRGPGFWQIDLSLMRKFSLTEKLSLELRAEAFNVLNHANFLFPQVISATRNATTGVVTVPSNFGLVTRSAARAYNGGGNTGGFNPLFQNGGPRSMQFGIRLSF